MQRARPDLNAVEFVEAALVIQYRLAPGLEDDLQIFWKRSRSSSSGIPKVRASHFTKPWPIPNWSLPPLRHSSVA